MSDRSVRFILVGGFLGAGKTTTLARLARHFIGQGRTVGIVTNDQAGNLVDTQLLREQGFPVNEVTGACFCCQFDELARQLEDLEQRVHPDVFLAEPVGSCVDLAATVLQPLLHRYGRRLRIAPYAVLFKPVHGLRILGSDTPASVPPGGFSPQAAYIFRKQLEEADVILVNRADEYSRQELQALQERISQQYPETPVLIVSAKTGQGFAEYLELLTQEGNFGRRLLEVDYDLYAAGEAELGWLNSTVELQADVPFSLDDWSVRLLQAIREELAQGAGEIAHAKVICLGELGFASANLVASASRVELGISCRVPTRRAACIVNLRAAASPESLEHALDVALRHCAHGMGIQATLTAHRALRPGRPQPTYRYRTPVASA